MVGRFAVCRSVASFAMKQEAFVLHGRLQGEERETAIGLTKANRATAKSASTVLTGIKVAVTGAPDATQRQRQKGLLYSTVPQYRRAFLDWHVFHNEPGSFTALEQSQAIAQAAQCGAAPVTRYEQLRPWDKLIPLAEQISTWRAQYSAGIAADMADTCKQFLRLSSDFLFPARLEEYAEVLGRFNAIAS